MKGSTKSSIGRWPLTRASDGTGHAAKGLLERAGASAPKMPRLEITKVTFG